MTRRIWWKFVLPSAIAFVPANSEEEAIKALANNCYQGAPARSWSTGEKIVCTREELCAR